MRKQSTISCIGSNYLESIVSLYETMNNFQYSGSSKIQVSPRENGFSVSIIVLTVLMIESAINRIKHLETNNTKNNIAFVRECFKNNKLSDELTEIYIIRDVIAHNHLWKIDIEYTKNFTEKILNKELMNGYGESKKYKNFVKDEVTKNLKLNIIPTKINKADVLKTFNFLYHFLTFAEIKNYEYFKALSQGIKYKGKLMTFITFLEKEVILKFTSHNTGLPVHKLIK